ncbi:hypothetical protein NliqN6_0024 [Naganishia liquefaciens]|uniref:Uncharacterized protein n=1 Tax=Naganishia liquefaciens TaxID=104408 RepID=A0A8H3YCU8_9TREE|nr:hypothetical protein NliqN6_0024 [Naganishia liquefaciens]
MSESFWQDDRYKELASFSGFDWPSEKPWILDPKGPPPTTCSYSSSTPFTVDWDKAFPPPCCESVSETDDPGQNEQTGMSSVRGTTEDSFGTDMLPVTDSALSTPSVRARSCNSLGNMTPSMIIGVRSETSPKGYESANSNVLSSGIPEGRAPIHVRKSSVHVNSVSKDRHPKRPRAWAIWRPDGRHFDLMGREVPKEGQTTNPSSICVRRVKSSREAASFLGGNEAAFIRVVKRESVRTNQPYPVLGLGVDIVTKAIT